MPRCSRSFLFIAMQVMECSSWLPGCCFFVLSILFYLLAQHYVFTRILVTKVFLWGFWIIARVLCCCCCSIWLPGCHYVVVKVFLLVFSTLLCSCYLLGCCGWFKLSLLQCHCYHFTCLITTSNLEYNKFALAS